MSESPTERNGAVFGSPYSPNWKSIWKGKVSSKPSGLWTIILDFVPPQKKVKFAPKADGKWNYKPDGNCGPDGNLTELNDTTDYISQEAPVGALIGKLGGSTVGKEGKIFTVGRFCVVETKDDMSGALFLTMNDAPSSFANHQGDLEVEVFVAM